MAGLGKNPFQRLIAPLLVLSLLVGCGTVANVFKSDATKAPAPVRGEVAKIGQPYKIGGNWYYPAYDPDYDQVVLRISNAPVCGLRFGEPPPCVA